MASVSILTFLLRRAKIQTSFYENKNKKAQDQTNTRPELEREDYLAKILIAFAPLISHLITKTKRAIKAPLNMRRAREIVIAPYVNK
jgi:hypothetical protein